MNLYNVFLRYLGICSLFFVVSCIQGGKESHPPPLIDKSGYTYGKSGVSKYIKIKQGDTLGAIAKRHNVSKTAIIEQNNLYKPYDLFAGSNILIPTEKLHIVTKGQSLIEVSQIYNVRVDEIVYLNRLQYPYHIHDQQKLVVPYEKYIAPTKNIHSIASRQQRAKKDSKPLPQIQRVPQTKKAPKTNQKNFRTPKSTPSNSDRDFVWPLDGKVIAEFGRSGSVFNEGVNIAVANNTPIKSIAEGKVIFTGYDSAYGKLLIIEHKGGIRSAYAHNSEILVTEGQKIPMGAIISKAGKSGNVKIPQLHFSVEQKGRVIDPNTLIIK